MSHVKLRGFISEIAQLVDKNLPEAHLLEQGAVSLSKLIAEDDWLPMPTRNRRLIAISNSCFTPMRVNASRSSASCGDQVNKRPFTITRCGASSAYCAARKSHARMHAATTECLSHRAKTSCSNGVQWRQYHRPSAISIA